MAPCERNVKNLRRHNVVFVGEVQDKFKRSKLPNNRETLQVLFNEIQINGKTVNDSIWHTTKLIVPFWTKISRIPIIQEIKIFGKLKKLYEEWRLLKKNRLRKSASQISKEAKFQERLEELFDIARSDALTKMENEEDKQFLTQQRLPGRPGTITQRKDVKLATEECALLLKRRRSDERKEQQKRFKETYEKRNSYVQVDQNDLEQSELEVISTSFQDESEPETSDGHRGTINIITPAVAATCDAIGISSRNATVLMSVITKALGCNVADYNLNYASLHKLRAKHRTEASKQIKDNFNPDQRLTLHWDGKIVPDLTGNQKTDRIAIVVTGVTTDQILAVPKIAVGTGVETAKVVFKTVEEWDLCSNITAFSFDTTSVNTGLANGAAVILQEFLGHDVLLLACRHHIPEIVLAAVIELNLNPSGGPDIKLFQRFRENWQSMDLAQFSTGVADERVMLALDGDEMDFILKFATDQLKTFQPRDDYKEMLCLVIIFLGGVPPSGIRFMAPGAISKTRWMAKGIYSLKIFLFQGQFKLTPREKKGIFVICIFLVKVYLRWWYRAPSAIGAPQNDLEVIADLKKFRGFDEDTAKVALRKVSNHLWYVSESLAPLALFDERISSDNKRIFVQNIKHKIGLPNPPVRLNIYAEECPEMSDLFTTNSMAFFQIMHLPYSFLEFDPATWPENSEYQEVKKIVKALKVVNDHAERSIKLMSAHNKKVTSEDRFQDLLQVAAKTNKNVQKSKKVSDQNVETLNL